MSLPLDRVRLRAAPPEGGRAIPARDLDRRMSGTIVLGCVVIALFVLGLGLWAAWSPVAGAVTAAGVIKVENNRKTLRRLEPGRVKSLLVREGEAVASGQLLMTFEDAEPRAQRDVLQASYDSLLGEQARFEAELTDRSAIVFPAALTARASEPGVADIMRGEATLFRARRQLLSSQVAVGSRRVQELGHQISGVEAQVASSDRQIALNAEELKSVQTLYDSGYAPKSRLLALQRSDASLAGGRGEQISEIARAQQAVGEAKVQTLSALQGRISEAATGLQQTRDKLADIVPRLAAARLALEHTEIRAPVAGEVFNLTQFTEGAAVNAGEPLLDIVPKNASLIVQAMVRPPDVHWLHTRQDAFVTLSGFNSRTTPKLSARVIRVAADETVDPHSGKAYFTADLRVSPQELRRLAGGVRLKAGMPVSVSVVTASRSILDYLLGPLGDMLGRSLHEA